MCTRCSFLGGVAAFALAPLAASARTGDPQDLEIAMPGMKRYSDTLWLGRLSPKVWIHTMTHRLDDGTWYPANGLIVVDGKEAVLVDSWSPAQAAELLDVWHASHGPAITKALATHFHTDRVGGIPELSKRGIPTYANPLTIGLALDRGFPVPKPLHRLDREAQTFGSLDVFFPGGGHTSDNIVVWIPQDRVLFGGCLVKATTAKTLGNLDDADKGAYAATMRTLIARYKPQHVIPGHGTISGDSLTHTLAMAEALA